MMLHHVQQNYVLIKEAEHMFSSCFSPKIIPLNLLFHRRNTISVVSSHPLQGKITGLNPNRKQSHAMVANLLPASEDIATFAPYVSHPPKHTQSSQLHTHFMRCVRKQSLVRSLSNCSVAIHKPVAISAPFLAYHDNNNC